MTAKNFQNLADQQFFTQMSAQYKLDEIEELSLTDEDLRSAFAVFKATMKEIIGAAQAFFNMTLATTLEARFNKLFMANQLRVRADFIRNSRDQNEDEIRREAQKRTLDELSRHNDNKEILKEVAQRLVELSANEPDLIGASNNAILRQSTVMLWSATENLLREFFRVTINRQPQLSMQLFESGDGKRYWNSKDITIDIIQSADFNLMQCMGDVILEINPMISLKSIKAAYTSIYPSSEDLIKTLNSQPTYNLFGLRNLVAHRNGLVDEKFLSETSFTVALGEKIIISPSDFEGHYMAAKAIGLKLFECAL